ncbi:MAG: hypothetical protein ABSF33_14130 [Acidimicrobiales bacterium]|jgi:hypothetical protein
MRTSHRIRHSTSRGADTSVTLALPAGLQARGTGPAMILATPTGRLL